MLSHQPQFRLRIRGRIHLCVRSTSAQRRRWKPATSNHIFVCDRGPSNYYIVRQDPLAPHGRTVHPDTFQNLHKAAGIFFQAKMGLLNLPLEILDRIVEEVPDSRLSAWWGLAFSCWTIAPQRFRKAPCLLYGTWTRYTLRISRLVGLGQGFERIANAMISGGHLLSLLHMYQYCNLSLELSYRGLQYPLTCGSFFLEKDHICTGGRSFDVHPHLQSPPEFHCHCHKLHAVSTSNEPQTPPLLVSVPTPLPI